MHSLRPLRGLAFAAAVVTTAWGCNFLQHLGGDASGSLDDSFPGADGGRPGSGPNPGLDAGKLPDGGNVPDSGYVPPPDAGHGPPPDAGQPPDAGHGPPPDAGQPPDAGHGPPPDAGSGGPTGWLHTLGNHIYKSDGTIWLARGANLHDTRSCDACTFSAPNVAEVNRRADELVNVWKANFIRLDLESYASSGGRVQWQSVVNDSSYLADLQSIVAHVTANPGVYVLLSLWNDPTFDANGWPTYATAQEWQVLAQAFKDNGQVLFGVANEPQANYDGSLDSQVWTAMNNVVAAIRQTEDAAGTPHHLVSVQGTRSWARWLTYYVSHPIAAGGGQNVVYETHAYDPSTDFATLITSPAQTLPIIIGEFGPSSGVMALSDCTALMTLADQLQVPYLAWTFHMRCSPNLLQDNSGGGCGAGMSLAPTTDWGALLKGHLTQF